MDHESSDRLDDSAWASSWAVAHVKIDGQERAVERVGMHRGQASDRSDRLIEASKDGNQTFEEGRVLVSLFAGRYTRSPGDFLPNQSDKILDLPYMRMVYTNMVSDEDFRELIESYLSPPVEPNPAMEGVEIVWVRDDPKVGSRHIQNHGITEKQVEEVLFEVPPYVEARRHRDYPDRTIF